MASQALHATSDVSVGARANRLLADVKSAAALWDVDFGSLLEEYTASIQSGDGVNFAEAAMLVQGSAAAFGKTVDCLYVDVNETLKGMGKDVSGVLSKKGAKKAQAPEDFVDEENFYPFNIETISKMNSRTIADESMPPVQEEMGLAETFVRRVPLFLIPREGTDRNRHDFKISGCEVDTSTGMLVYPAILGSGIHRNFIRGVNRLRAAHAGSHPIQEPVIENSRSPSPDAKRRTSLHFESPSTHMLPRIPAALLSSQVLPSEQDFDGDAIMDTVPIDSNIDLDANEDLNETLEATQIYMRSEPEGNLRSRRVSTDEQQARPTNGDLPEQHQLIELDAHVKRGRNAPFKRFPANLLKEFLKPQPSAQKLKLDDPTTVSGGVSSRLSVQKLGIWSPGLIENLGELVHASVRENRKARVRVHKEQETSRRRAPSIASNDIDDEAFLRARLSASSGGESDSESDTKDSSFAPRNSLGAAVPEEIPLSIPERERRNASLAQELEAQKRDYDEEIRGRVEEVLKSSGGIDGGDRLPDLYNSVRKWQDNLEPLLKEQNDRPPFDLNNYTAGIIEKLKNEPRGVPGVASFADLVDGQPQWNVSRLFVSALILTNNGNLDIMQTQEEGADESASPDRGRSTQYSAAPISPSNRFGLKLINPDKSLTYAVDSNGLPAAIEPATLPAPQVKPQQVSSAPPRKKRKQKPARKDQSSSDDDLTNAYSSDYNS